MHHLNNIKSFPYLILYYLDLKVLIFLDSFYLFLPRLFTRLDEAYVSCHLHAFPLMLEEV